MIDIYYVHISILEGAQGGKDKKVLIIKKEKKREN